MPLLPLVCHPRMVLLPLFVTPAIFKPGSMVFKSIWIPGLKDFGMTEGVDSLNASITPCLSPPGMVLLGSFYSSPRQFCCSPWYLKVFDS